MRRLFAGAAAVLAAATVAAAARAADGHDGHDGHAGTAGQTAGVTREVSMPGKAYVPQRLDVLVGDTVTWRNTDTINHTVTARDDAFDSGFVPPGGTFSQAFDRPATIPYACTIHKFMTGTIRVVPVALRGPEGAVRANGVVSLTGLAPTADDVVAVERRVGRRWLRLRVIRPGADGVFGLRVRVGAPTAFRARVGRASSAIVPVHVAPRVEGRVTGAVVRASVRPARPGARAVLQRYDRERFAWRTVARGRVAAGGTAVTLSLAGPRRGHVRIVVRGGRGWADGASAAVRVG